MSWFFIVKVSAFSTALVRNLGLGLPFFFQSINMSVTKAAADSDADTAYGVKCWQARNPFSTSFLSTGNRSAISLPGSYRRKQRKQPCFNESVHNACTHSPLPLIHACKIGGNVPSLVMRSAFNISKRGSSPVALMMRSKLE
ncbi:hypothetical protein D9M71_697980 [compost metagenome]